MKFSLIICTYMRPEPLNTLLASVMRQTLRPDEILVIDGSTDSATRDLLDLASFPSLHYFKVPDEDRGLTRQRNYGIARVSPTSEIVCFLDDDTILEPEYFEELLSTYLAFPDALAVGGYITNEVHWTKMAAGDMPTIHEFCFDGWKRKDGSRYVLRKKLGLDTNVAPGFAPDFSNGRSIGFLPPSGQTYAVEQLMGGVSSFRASVFKRLGFSTYFDGYGLYEDADFSYRLLPLGKLYVNTAARLEHHHAPSGRPNQYRYGKMVVRNGWYVWRVRTPNPSLKAIVKWHAITLLLATVRATNAIFGTSGRKQALTESAGRFVAYAELFWNQPKPETPKTKTT